MVSIDSATERAIAQLCKNRTTVIATNRLLRAINADEILVLDKGRIVERGR
jgi:ATP-binding cassette subfamily B protein